jgi:glycosyltransferase involved in cell wall biosynthesis
MPDGQPRVSVVIATRDRVNRLRRLLVSLEAQTLGREEFEVIVVDDASDDETRSVLADAERTGGLRLRTITRERPGGPGAARNEGVACAQAGLIAFTDDDCEPTPSWLEAGIQAWDGRKDRFVQGCTVPNPAERDRLGPFTRTIEVTKLTPSFQTCNMFFPRALLVELDGFDSGYAFWGEDTDLAWRSIEAGAQPVFAAEALVHHAVNELGLLGSLHLAASWTTAMRPYAAHPELRNTVFTYGLFWKREHYWLARALVASALPRRWLPLRIWLAFPYLRMLRARGMAQGPGLVPFYVLRDLIELGAIAVAALRYRTPML